MKGENRMGFKDKVALVTGAGQGIGQAIALALAREGADVIVNDINPQSANDVADQIESLGRRAQAIKADVANSREVNQMAKQALDTFGKIDILVNNAGIFKLVPILDLSEADWDNIIDVNLKGQFLCSQAVGRQMIKQKGGKIVNIASVAAHSGSPGQAAYCVSKGGVLQLTRSLAVEWARYNINVNAVSPAMTETPMFEKTRMEFPGFVEPRLNRMPFRRAIKPASIARAVLFLASSESDDVTGQEIIVDCGTCALYPAYVWPEEQPKG